VRSSPVRERDAKPPDNVQALKQASDLKLEEMIENSLREAQALRAFVHLEAIETCSVISQAGRCLMVIPPRTKSSMVQHFRLAVKLMPIMEEEVFSATPG
jgi:hypothetical protein